MVAHPLELVADVVEGQEEAQVAGDRGLGRDRPGDQPRDLALHLVDPPVAEDHRRRGVGVVGGQGRHRVAQRFLHVRAHPEDVVLDLAHLAVEHLARRATGTGRASTSRGVSARIALA